MFENSYSKPTRLFVSGGGEIISSERASQGDPLTQAIYAVPTIPLIKYLQQACPSTTQSWHADNDGAGDNLITLRKYWDKISRTGPGYGYCPYPAKTMLLTKLEFREETQ